MAQLANDWLHHAPGAQDFSDAYLGSSAQIDVALDAVACASPIFGQFLITMSRAQRMQSYAAYWQRLERAFAGDWSAMQDYLRERGERYARSGATLADWQGFTHATTDIIQTRLVENLAAEPARLTAALQTMQRFFDRSLQAFHDAFSRVHHERFQETEALFRGMPLALAVIDEDSTILKANQAFVHLYGRAERELLGTPLAALFHPDDLVRVRAAYTEEAKRVGVIEYETLHLRADATIFPAQALAVRISLAGQPALWGISIVDLTERKQTELLMQRSAQLETENAKVREVSRLKSEFLANMSHELRTPLNSILGFSELMVGGEVGPLTAQQLDFLQDINSSGKHLLRLINDVLDLSKVESGKLEFFPEEVDLESLARQVAQIMRGLAPETRVEVDVDADARAAYLDAARMKQVLYNYLSNAIKFSPRGGVVHVRVVASGSTHFRLDVIDRGPGIADGDRARLFVMFEQLDHGRSKTHAGTGLGLALTRRLVEAQGGSVGVDSVLGSGSTFYAILPKRVVVAATN